jgi:PPOX class probable FMN-dependent enzyme
MAVTSEARLREIYGAASPRALAKELDRLDGHCLDFIAASPFLLLATSDGERIDVSPKGDAAGFVRVDAEGRLLIPDWPGNARLDGLRNILKAPQVGVIFLIPGVRETLRVNGAAEILDEAAARRPFARGGRLPLTVLRVTPREAFVHCAKAFLRSGLWEPATWPEARPVAPMGEMLRDHARLTGEVEDDAAMIARYRGALY